MIEEASAFEPRFYAPWRAALGSPMRMRSKCPPNRNGTPNGRGSRHDLRGKDCKRPDEPSLALGAAGTSRE